MKALFIRHGKAESNENPLEGTVGQPSNLTAEGRRQIEATAKFLGSFILTKTIYTSPLPRTRQSAKIIADMLHLTVIVDERLAEIYKGDWQGEPVHEVVQKEAEIDIDKVPFVRPPHGENWVDVGSRVAEFVEEQRLAGIEELLLVSHNHPIEMGIGKLLGKPIPTWEDLGVDNAGVTEIEYSHGQWNLHPTIVNITPYLPE